MSILIDSDTRVIVHGTDQNHGVMYTEAMMLSGTQVVGAISPGHGGDWLHGKPIFETVQNAVYATGANTSVILVPAAEAADAIYESVDAGIDLIICVTKNIPLIDAIKIREYIRFTKSRLIGPNAAGIAIPNVGTVGVIPHQIMKRGSTGIISRSSTLAFEVTHLLTMSNNGQSAVVCLGNDRVLGTKYIDILRMFENDLDTNRVVLLGEIGGDLENEAATYIQSHMSKTVIAYIAGQNLPEKNPLLLNPNVNRQKSNSARHKIDILRNAGAHIANRYTDIISML